MSLARNLSAFERVSGNTARSLAPEIQAPTRPAVRPSSRPKRSIGRTVVSIGLLWAIMMSMALVSVWRHAAAQQEQSALTQAKDQLERLNRENRALEDQLVTATSANAVRDWALAHGMQRPSAFKPLAQDPTAVASRPAPAPEEAAAAPVASPGFWDSVKTALGRALGSGGSAAPGR